jgi:protein-S-isoprenylcysteine O-methyltransferase Ste14
VTIEKWLGVVLGLAVFGAGSYAIVRLSKPSLRDPSSHGFYRAFAFDALLALFLVNMTAWLTNPFGPLQLASWLLLTASAALAVHGFTLLRRAGRPSGALESTTVLVTSGMYRFIRHPLYASLLYLGWGILLKRLTPISATLAAAVTLFLYLTARAEEKENVDKFGAAYVEYMARTRRFIPFLF